MSVLGGYNDDANTNSEAEGETNPIDEYNDRNQITVNQELLVPELLQQHLAQPSQNPDSHHDTIDINSINQHQQHGSGVHPSLSETQSNICNIIPVTQVTNQEIITNSSIADQIVPINTHHEISHMHKDSISVITSENIDCSNVPEVTPTIDDRINVLNPNPHHSVYSLTSL